MSETVHLTVNIDKDLRKELKKIALEQERTVTDIIIDLVKEFVAEHEKE